MALSMRATARECLNITGAVSARRDILAIRELPPPRSLRDELNFIRRTRCRPNRPSDLRVTATSDGRIDLRWIDNSDNEEGFRIHFRGERTGFGDHVDTRQTNQNQNHVSLTGLRSGFTYTIRVVAHNPAGESPPSNEVQATTPNVPVTETVNLSRQTIVQGNIPYAGRFPDFGVVPAGRLLRIRVPEAVGFHDFALAFVKRGHSTEECGDASAVVVIRDGQTTTPEQLREIYGVAEPTFTVLAPVPFIACYGTNNPSAPLPNFITIQIDVIYG